MVILRVDKFATVVCSGYFSITANLSVVCYLANWAADSFFHRMSSAEIRLALARCLYKSNSTNVMNSWLVGRSGWHVVWSLCQVPSKHCTEAIWYRWWFSVRWTAVQVKNTPPRHSFFLWLLVSVEQNARSRLTYFLVIRREYATDEFSMGNTNGEMMDRSAAIWSSGIACFG